MNVRSAAKLVMLFTYRQLQETTIMMKLFSGFKVRLKNNKIVHKLGRVLLKSLTYSAALFGVSAFMIGFIVMASVVEIFGLFILEIILFGNLILMIVIIPVGLMLRK
jgi:hypothetical protein